MQTPLALSLYRLPRPVVVRELDYEALLQKRRDQFLALWQIAKGRNPNLPDFDTLLLESEPANILLQHAAFADLLFVSELNDVARVIRLISFAEGSDLDLHAAEVGLSRLSGESDADLRARVIERRRGSSAAGPDEWFSWHALSAHPDVAEVSVEEVAGGLVDVAVRSRSGDGVPSEQVMDAVRGVLTSRAVRPRCVRVTVSAAIPHDIDVEAAVTLDRDTLDEVFTDLRDNFAASFAERVRLGRDITRTWLSALLTAPGVRSVNIAQPASDVILPYNRIGRLGAVNITLAGRDW